MNPNHINIVPQRFDGADSCLMLDAQATLQEVYEALDSPKLLRQTLSGSTSQQKRSGITVAEAVYSPRLAPQWLAALLALGTRVKFPDGTGLLADFLRRTSSHHRRLQAVLVPLNVSGRVWGEVNAGQTGANAPIVSAIAVVDLGEEVVHRARLALTAVQGEQVCLVKAVDLLVGQPLNHATIGQVKDVVEQETGFADDCGESAIYRKAMTGILTHRALIFCMEKGSH